MLVYINNSEAVKIPRAIMLLDHTFKIEGQGQSLVRVNLLTYQRDLTADITLSAPFLLQLKSWLGIE
jgi:hypothetical protein